MRTVLIPASIVLLMATSVVHADSQRDPHRPCFSVNIQNEPVNSALVRQSCRINYSRTVQAGNENTEKPRTFTGSRTAHAHTLLPDTCQKQTKRPA